MTFTFTFFKRFFLGLVFLSLFWLLFSWVDVVQDNCYESPTHGEANAFVLLMSEGD